MKNGMQAEVPTCDRSVQIDKTRNDCSILLILSIVCYIFRNNDCNLYFT